MGEVYLAQHLALEKPVALRILPPNLGAREHIERFLKEARVCSRIEHPNVVVIHDVGEEGGLYFIIMQYIQGRNLLQVVQDQGGPLPWRSAARIIQLVARGLHAVHNQGLVHRDVKPTNIMLSSDLRVLLMDFGLVREESDSSLTRTGQVVGTPAFMSPEQCQGKPLDRRSDIFSLGGTMYCLLTAKPPFEGTVGEVVGAISSGIPPAPVDRINIEVPHKVQEFLARAMARRAESRFPTALAMANELRDLIRAAPARSDSIWRTDELSAASVETHREGQLPVIELLPLETRKEWLREKLPWLYAGGAILAAFLIVGLVLNFTMGQKAFPPPPPPDVRVREAPAGMVFVEVGFARLGNSELKVRNCLSDYMNDQSVEAFLKFFRQEPQRRVHVPAFWIDQYEVTNAQYAKFIRETGRAAPADWTDGSPPPGKDDHPVVGVRYEDAEAYARWAGKDLPTREQWMRAYRGDHDWLFPWGDKYDAARTTLRTTPSSPRLPPCMIRPRT